ncbi:MAG: hypothetical protein R3B96_12215 [Pirellulaceae bacterium]
MNGWKWFGTATPAFHRDRPHQVGHAWTTEDFNDLPSWQKRGVGLYWEQFARPAVNPVTNEDIAARRCRIRIEFDLPMKDDYGQLVRSIISNAKHKEPDDGTSHGDFTKYPRTPHLFGSKGTEDDRHLGEAESRVHRGACQAVTTELTEHGERLWSLRETNA